MCFNGLPFSTRFISTSAHRCAGSHRMSIIKHKKSLFYSFRDRRINKRTFRHYIFSTLFSSTYGLGYPKRLFTISFLNHHNIFLNKVGLYYLAKRQIYAYDRFLILVQKLFLKQPVLPSLF